ncbi:uncharacterized protein LOC129293242 isoform X1 [Prosopis cineraria]|uniref:uncharacterized protein LOC129293242 isoform X1 n=1 Tax=Prosopis cineraria TaxID=364024 RepID=UPI00241028A6|nr:uncharacterized protein LOC129293242 isoform X1 [Prosopis cineraria]XP_054787060.1 uncharacterized protein LOC129293242 isoform X1 [Prosopis cineraria]XP_054787061.1 uncharacterized protein LOC129293242 isoform X1 [Prosopis cineraria]XP_054787062.1 uncharacterized protein LOC129293242 isoform X1 [Prosopis cineraria]XP_054787063.1 uncharacterized protein LOC129293242 isoform X1 [Prosopis cineraria]XP_054787064.1 uncharacterized protein LOC129293242 isoform X1 [Prosopis cineraria]
MEFLVAIGVGIVSKLGEVLVDPITSQFKLMIHYDKNINKMKNELNNLEDRKRVIEGTVDADRRNGRHITPNVEHWLYQVDNIIENESWKVYDDELVNNNKNCLGGLCPNLVFRYSLSKKARKMTRDLVSLKEQKLEFISYPIPLPTLGSTFTEGIKSFASRESIMEEVIERLKGDEFHRISICGMGGVGKTTLVKELIKVLEADKVFDEISMAIVSQVPDYRKIQGQIGDTLGLKFDKETLQGRACQLLERLNKINKVFLVLDDVWTELDLELIGLPSNEQSHKGCKILFTSRNEDVCHRMRSQRNFTIPILSKEEAWDLFRYTAGDHVVDKAEMHNISKQVANECRGLPIAIVTIGKALGNKDKHVWEDALDQLRRSSLISFSEMQEYSIYSCIELSYNFLGNEEAKFLLLLCSLFPEDFDIPIEVLLRYGVGLGLFKDLGALFKARNRVHTLIDTLKKRFLLLDSNKEECVKMHDVVRDTVIIIASREEHGFAVKYDVGQEGLNDEFIWHHNAISLLLDEIKMHHKSLQCPNLRLLQVFIKRRESISENFFHNMSKLMVLGLSNLCIPSMSSLFQTLNNLCTLRLEDCQVGDISIICKELRKLEVLSFAYSNIKELPVEIGKLSLLRLLDLTECNNLDQISSGVLASLSYLEELYLRVWNSHWEGKNSILAELESLSHQLKVFEISITGIHIFPKDLEFKKLIKFWIYVRDSTTLYHGLVRRGYLYPNILKLNSVYYKDIKENVAIQQLLKKSEILNLVNVKQLENVLYELDEEGFPCLKNLSIEFCNDLKYLIDESVYASSCAFRLVQSLSLNNLDNLREVCHAKSFTSSSCQCFGSLRDLKVEFCNKLKYVFSPSLSLSIGLLQRLHVTECYEVKYIVSKEIHVENLVIKFTNLVELKLEELPSFVGFTISDHKNELHLLNSQVQEEQKLNDDLHQAGSNSTLGIDRSVHIGNTLFESKWMAQFPKLKKIILLECSLLDTIFDLQRLQIEGQSIPMLFSQLKEIEISWLSKLRQIWSNVPSDIQGFQNLRSIKVKKCDSLRSIFTPTIARTLTQLQKLVIQSCQLMEKVIEDDREEQEKVETLLFTKLDSLTLKDLPSLMSICSVCYELTWPSLRYLCIDGCPQLKISSIPIQTLTKQENLKNSFSDSTLQAIGFSTTKFLPYCLGCTRSNIEISNSIGKSNFQRVGKINKKASLMRDHISSDVKKVYSREEMRSYMPNLEQLQVKGWNSLDVIFQLEKNQHSNTSINCVVKLVPMLTSPTSITSFNNLILLSLEACPNLRYLFSHSIAKLLRNLQEVKLSNCRMVEQLVKSEDGSVMFSHASSLKAVEDALPSHATSISKESFVLEFPSLKRISIINCIMLKVIIKDGEWRTDMTSFNQVQSLTLSHLPNLVSFCYQPCIPEQPSLEKCKANNHYQQVQVTYDEKRMIRNDPSINYLWFSHLTYLGIKECQKINCLFSPSSSASLVCLQELEICNCENIKEIVSKQEIHEGFFKIMFPRLQRLKLEHLSNLEAFCHSSYDLDFPLLQEVCFGNCHRMEIFSNGFATTPKLNGITMKVGKLTNIIWMGDLNTTAQLSKGLLAFQTSERLEWLKQEQGMLSYFMKEIEMNVESFQSLLALVPSNVIHLFQNLKNLTIKDCGSLIEVFESEGVNKNKRQSMIHYELEVMNLHFLPKLIHIWKNHGGVLDFQKLRILKVEYCGNLKGILSPSMAKSLVQLQHFRVCNCQMIEEIVIKEAEENERESKAEILFPLLNKLELRYLPNLKSYCAESIDIELPFCEEMIIEKCPKMMTFSYGAVSTPKLPNIYKGSYEYVDIMGDLNMTIYQAHSEDLKVALQRSETINWIEQDKILLGYITRITELVFEGCEKLLNCVPSNMIHRLQHLKQLKVRECCSLVEIFESEGVEANEDEKHVVTLHEYNLQEMYLYSLPKIMHIWKNHGEVLSFRNLKKLNMGCCDGLRSVVPFSIAKTLLQLQELSIYECEMIER